MKKFNLFLYGIFSLLILLVPYNVNAAVQIPITRAQAEQRALNMINLKWTYANNKNAVLPSLYQNDIMMPIQFKGAENVTEYGIPYCWGGLDGLDSSSYNEPWTSFVNAIGKSAYAGNVGKSQYGHIPGTAGLDCSGFVQSVFNIKDYKLSTSTIFNQYFQKIDINNIKHMDILNKPGSHVVIFDKWGTKNGIQGAYTYEATPDTTYGGIQGTKQYFISMNTINSGYIAGKYVNIKEVQYVKLVNAYCLNIRKGPSTSYSIVGTLSLNQYAKVIDNSSTPGWYKISINGIEGYASSKYLSYVNN